MKRSALARIVGQVVQLRPVPISVFPDGSRIRRNHDWYVKSIDNDGRLRAKNRATDHVARLASDCIHHYDEDPHSERDGYRHGFLHMTAQMYFDRWNVWIEPLAPHVRRAHFGG